LSDPEFRSFRSAFETMRVHYRRGEWKHAINALETSRQHYVNPRIYRLLDIYELRIAGLKRHSSLHGWNGVFSDMFPGVTGSLSADQNCTTTQSCVEGSWTESKLKCQSFHWPSLLPFWPLRCTLCRPAPLILKSVTPSQLETS